jgi:hypothetical protein
LGESAGRLCREPKKSVEQADRLVTEAINNLAEGFSTQRHNLEQQWHREGDVSTEDLRLAFRRLPVVL